MILGLDKSQVLYMIISLNSSIVDI